MKRILLFCICLFSISFYSFEQNQYSLDNEEIIYDIPGGNFLTAAMSNNKLKICELDLSGNQVWSDSLPFQLALDSVEFDWISKFEEEDKYVICLKRTLVPGPFFYAADEIAYQFTTLDLNTHQFTASIIDTLLTKSIRPLTIDSNMIYLFVTDHTNGTVIPDEATFSLDESLNFAQVAASDSINSYSGLIHYAKHGNEIFRHQYINDLHNVQKYSFDMTLVSENYFNTETGLQYDNAIYTSETPNDSIFTFTEGTESGVAIRKWLLQWTDCDGNVINSSLIEPATLLSENSTLFVTSVQDDPANQLIYVLTGDASPIQADQVLCVFDYNFNLVCDMKLNNGDFATNTLTYLNNKVYLRNDISGTDSVNYDLMICSGLEIENISESNFDFQPYPNPTNQDFFIPNEGLLDIEVFVISSMGETLFSQKTNSELFQIDMSSYSTGLYHVQVKTAKTIKNWKLLKN